MIKQFLGMALGVGKQQVNNPVVASFAEQWSDNFTRDDAAALGGDWTEHGTYTGFAIASNKLSRGAGATNGAAYAGGDAVATSKNRYKFTLTGVSNTSLAVADNWAIAITADTEADFPDANCSAYFLTNSGGSMVLYRKVVADETLLATFGTGLVAATPYKISLEVLFSGGTCTITCEVDDVVIDDPIVDETPITALQTSMRPAILSGQFPGVTATGASVSY